MEVLTELVRNVIVIVLLTTFLDLLLPSSNMQRFVKVIMGLFILVSVLTPVLSLLSREQDFAVFNWSHDNPGQRYTTVLQDSSRLTAVNQELFLQNYRARVEKQMEALVLLVRGVGKAQVTVQLQQSKAGSHLEGIKNVEVLIGREPEEEAAEDSVSIEPIKVEISLGPDSVPKETETGYREAATAEEKRIASEVRRTIAQYFGLELQQIKVFFE